MWFLLCSGKFEKYPGLKFATTEAGCFWAADLLWTMDEVFNRNHGARKTEHRFDLLKMRPSEYFDRNIKIGSSNTRRRELGRRYEIGVDNIMWGADYPHNEGTTPYSHEALRYTFAGVDPLEVRTMLGTTAAKVYDFDLDHLDRLAADIGPTVEEVSRPLPESEIPPDGISTVWFEKVERRPF